MKNDKNQLQTITITALMIALTCVLTLAIKIPSPTKGYMNLGDCAVLFSGWLLGPVYGTIAGGVGSALADLVAGYPVYIPGTLIIKAAMAFVISLVPHLFTGNRRKYLRFGFIAGAVLSEIIMVTGYWLYEALIVGYGFFGALAGVSGNIMQGIAGAAGSYFLVEILSRTALFKTHGASGFVKGDKS